MGTAKICSILPNGSGFENYQAAEIPGLGDNYLTVAEAVMGRLLVIAWMLLPSWEYPEDEARAFVAEAGAYADHSQADYALALEGEGAGEWKPSTGTSGRQAWTFPRPRNPWAGKFD